MPEVTLTHRHPDGTIEQLTPEDEQAVDHLSVVRYRCSCGTTYILLAKMPDSSAGESWPEAVLRLVE